MHDRSFFHCRSCREPLYATSSVAGQADRDWEVDHQESGRWCPLGHLMPLTGTAPDPRALPDAVRILLTVGE
ncbi:hypothetical protein [Streptomyces sp. NPDC097619]|uniref:hypothetical protein n=1 Tax=Streptomyces sp. NPDC097619 TaxID=3157228 RepID=UPI00331E4C19